MICPRPENVPLLGFGMRHIVTGSQGLSLTALQETRVTAMKTKKKKKKSYRESGSCIIFIALLYVTSAPWGAPVRLKRDLAKVSLFRHQIRPGHQSSS